VLVAVKLIHTVAWAFFVLCIAGIPIMTWRGQYGTATWLAGIVFVEVLIILVNRWRCPLTPLAARYTEDRRDNFDIFLPEWLARHNKAIFGWLYIAGILYLAILWMTRNPG